MTIFITLVLALLIEHIFWNASTWRQGDWFAAYYQKVISAPSLARFSDHLSHSGWLLGPLVLCVSICQFILLPGLGSLIEWLFGLGALLFSMGPRNLGRDLEDYLQAKSTNQAQQAHQIAQYFGAHQTDSDARVKQGLLVQTSQSLIGPMLSFMLLGATGAVLFRAVQYLAQMHSASQPNARLTRSSQVLSYWVSWLPARMTLLGYAAVGHFEAVVSTWQQQERASRTTQDHTALLIATGQAALTGNMATGRASIIAHATLVKRTIVLWVSIAAVVALASL